MTNIFTNRDKVLKILVYAVYNCIATFDGGVHADNFIFSAVSPCLFEIAELGMEDSRDWTFIKPYIERENITSS